MKKIAFVILNYLTEDETEKCVDSIQKCCSNNEYKIYIVDNCSPNGSGKYLKKKYIRYNNIETILCDKNIGFARGNNVGFKKAKYEYKADFIVLCNSDTVILNSDFCRCIVEKYETDNYSVLGPKELLPDGTYYPLNDDYPTIDSVKRKIRLLDQKRLANEDLLYSLYYNTKNFFKKIIKVIIFKNNSSNCHKLDVNMEHKNIILHGFFLVFSKKYIEKFDGLDDRTYFYGEEDLLAIRLKESNLLSVYYPKIEVLHNKNSATNARNKSEKSKKKFIYENQIRSLELILEDLIAKSKK